MPKRIVVSLVGITFKNDEDGTSRQDLLGALYDDWWTEGREKKVKIELRAEPDNPHDSNAVGVWCVHPDAGSLLKDEKLTDHPAKLGHVPRDQAKVLCSRLDMIEKVELGKMKVGNKGGVTAILHLKVRRRVKDTRGRVYDLA